jgi:hypothetical protein
MLQRLAVYSLIFRLAGPSPDWARIPVLPPAYGGQAEVSGPSGFSATLEFEPCAGLLRMIDYRFAPLADETLPSRSTMALRFSDDGTRRVELADYREVAGIRLPHEILIRSAGSDERYEVERFEINPPISHRLYALIGR